MQNNKNLLYLYSIYANSNNAHKSRKPDNKQIQVYHFGTTCTVQERSDKSASWCSTKQLHTYVHSSCFQEGVNELF